MRSAVGLILVGFGLWFLAGPVYAWTWGELKLLSLVRALLMRAGAVALALIGLWRLISELIDRIPDR